MFTREMIIEMLNIQEQLEISISGENWREDRHDYMLAIHMECSEIVDHFGWKWWKDTDSQADWDQITLELIDIWHFALAHNLTHLSDGSKDYIDGLADDVLEQMYTCIDLINESKEDYNFLDVVVSTGYHCITTKQFPLANFIILCNEINLGPNDVYALYISKNALNKFRQDNGYKDGTYKKSWKFGDVELEDNQVLMEVLKEFVMEEREKVTAELITRRLEELYALA